MLKSGGCKIVEVTCRVDVKAVFRPQLFLEDDATKLKEKLYGAIITFGDAISGRTFPSNRINNNENRVFHQL